MYIQGSQSVEEGSFIVGVDVDFAIFSKNSKEQPGSVASYF